jgi:hypothetical protein
MPKCIGSYYPVAGCFRVKTLVVCMSFDNVTDIAGPCRDTQRIFAFYSPGAFECLAPGIEHACPVGAILATTDLAVWQRPFDLQTAHEHRQVLLTLQGRPRRSDAQPGKVIIDKTAAMATWCCFIEPP